MFQNTSTMDLIQIFYSIPVIEWWLRITTPIFKFTSAVKRFQWTIREWYTVYSISILFIMPSKNHKIWLYRTSSSIIVMKNLKVLNVTSINLYLLFWRIYFWHCRRFCYPWVALGVDFWENSSSGGVWGIFL